jgi:malate dehydrogenase (oxaloacetate-decarboxylating)
MAAAEAFAEASPAIGNPQEPLLPPVRNIRGVTYAIAQAVALRAQSDGVANRLSPEALEAELTANSWIPAHPALRRKRRPG